MCTLLLLLLHCFSFFYISLAMHFNVTWTHKNWRLSMIEFPILYIYEVRYKAWEENFTVHSISFQNTLGTGIPCCSEHSRLTKTVLVLLIKKRADNVEWRDTCAPIAWTPANDPFSVLITVNFLKCSPQVLHENATPQIKYSVMSCCHASAVSTTMSPLMWSL